MAYSVLIKGVDKTSLLKSGSLQISKGADNNSSCSLSLITDSTYINVAGLDLQVLDGSTVVFGGVIKTAPIVKLEDGAGTAKKLRIDISSDGYNSILARRTTSIYYEDKYAGEIVTALITAILNASGYSENITAGTISNGAHFDTYVAVCKNCKTILDELASASGFKWYIDDTKTLNFLEEDTVTDAAHDIVEGGAFTDYFIENVDISLENYRTRQYVRGGTAEDGTVVQVLVIDTAEETARQTAEGSGYSSGVYGAVEEDSNIQSVDDATTLANKLLEKYGFIPATVTFTSHTNDWIAGTKLKVNLPTFGIASDIYCLIESVDITDLDGVNLQSTITATKRKTDSFSTQRSENYIDYFAKLASKSDVSDGFYSTDGGATVSKNSNLWVDITAGIAAAPTKAKDVAVYTDDPSRYDYLAITATGTHTISATTAEFLEITGSAAVTLTIVATAATAGTVLMIKNSSSEIATLAATINGSAMNVLYPDEMIRLLWNGTDWRG